MLKTVCSEIIDKNTFLIHFSDKTIENLSPDEMDKLRNYETVDDSQIKMAIRNNADQKSVFIDLKIEYPQHYYKPNFYELMEINEKRFHYFYNDLMDYDQYTVDYDKYVNYDKMYKIKSH